MITATPIIAAVSMTVTAGALIWAASNDLRYYLIPNRIPVLIALAYAVIAFTLPLTFVVGGFLTGLAVLAVGTLVFARGWMGGGDVKLLAAVTLWAGPSLLLIFARHLAERRGSRTSFAFPRAQLLPAPSAGALELSRADGQHASAHAFRRSDHDRRARPLVAFYLAADAVVSGVANMSSPQDAWLSSFWRCSSPD